MRTRRTAQRSIVMAALLIVAFCRSLSAAPAETRYHQYCRKAQGAGGTIKPLAATYFGGPAVEEFVAVGFAPDDSVVAIGNAFGPQFPEVPNLNVIGEDSYTTAPPAPDAKGKAPNEGNPNMAAFVLHYSPDLGRILGGVRLGWGTATASHCFVSPGGAVYLSGRCSPAFRAWLGKARGGQTQVVSPPQGAKAGGADLYLAKLSLQNHELEWALVFEKAEEASLAWERRNGCPAGVRVCLRPQGELVLLAYDRLYLLGSNGKDLRPLADSRGGVLLATDPRDGSCFVGGDENTNTGREPWRRPFLRKFDARGELVWEIWRWGSKLVGTDQYRLVSDSGVHEALPMDNGDLVVVGWSDGGNTVFTREVAVLERKADYSAGFIDSLWGAGVGKFPRLMRIDSAKPAFKAGTVWCSFRVEQNRPNSSSITDIQAISGGRIAIVGNSASALVESPDAWARTFPKGTGGAYLAVLSFDLHDLLFSSLLPGVRGKPALSRKGTKLAIAGAATPSAPDEPKPILTNALQSQCGGQTDGYLLLVDSGLPAKP